MFLIVARCAHISRAQDAKAEIAFIAINTDMTLRRMIVHHASPKGVVLFLHGFPETLYAWKDLSLMLASDYEVHAFDWPGYGLSSRPPVERFSYAPQDYARVLKEYIRTSGIDTSMLVIYATDIGALPALLLALDEPHVAKKKMIVGDFAPFDRPQSIEFIPIMVYWASHGRRHHRWPVYDAPMCRRAPPRSWISPV
jgi:pimeloyl-ACP methyl ester carboxylesterase